MTAAGASAKGASTATSGTASAGEDEEGVECADVTVMVGRIFEESLEFQAAAPAPIARRARAPHVELVLDHAPTGAARGARAAPPPGAVRKRLEVDLNVVSVIQNMPCGRNYLIRAVLPSASGPAVRSQWVRARTLPETEATGDEAVDIHGEVRGKCGACPCKGFRWNRADVSLNSNRDAAVCRGCGCDAKYHRVGETAPAANETTKAPKESIKEPRGPSPRNVQAKAEDPVSEDLFLFDPRQRDLFTQSGGQFHPHHMGKLRRPEKNHPTSAEELRQCRISVVCPTMGTRRRFHEQLWAAFNAQDWEDKELIVVDTYVDRPSSFLQAKATVDPRLLYLAFKVEPGNDWSIGLKRNICTHLASGAIMANFDDDDLYAQRYLNVMVDAMIAQGSEAITLSSWYVYDAQCGKFGWVDAQRQRPERLYGYGFSYVFLRDVALRMPYPNANLGEDYAFFNMLRQTWGASRLGGQRHVAVVPDEYGICCHTLHAQATSGSFARREVPTTEVESLDVAQLGVVFEQYMGRVERTGGTSRYIKGAAEERTRTVQVFSSVGCLALPCSSGATAEEVATLFLQELLLGTASVLVQPSEVLLHREGMEPSGSEAPRAGGHALRSDERLGLRCTELWASMPVDRGTEPDADLTLLDMQDPSVFVTVRTHRVANVDAVRLALAEQHGALSPGSQQEAKGLQFAVRHTGYLVVCRSGEWLGNHNELFVRGLSDWLAAHATSGGDGGETDS